MKKLLVLLGFIAVVGYVSKADAADRWPRWYVGLTGSLGFELDDGFAGSSGFDNGYGFGGSIGYLPKLGLGALDNFRIEGEIFLRENNHKDGDETVESISYMGNLYYDLGRLESFPIIPYVGGGIGSTTIEVLDLSEKAFTWQLMGGVTFEFEEVPLVVFGIGYKYIHWNENDMMEDDVSNHNIEASMRLRF